ncbi:MULTISPECIES: hypothetical protein [Roseivirga]|jgi:hypothetical protein|uniref:SPW repeat-containing integral membrane domain-containing protein n=1 Tax=Roseivirga thermotolerans TaxID=1758176 RepID=A0ABQ3I5S5_9BACT|nr:MULTISPECIES: hypothetical protein [Roseivirga]MEC7752668.1 hypothetical protein [Bacteroidota bacterium]GHE66467.1 hypothetical protein GCM10011340_22230 [Roseivirga thermotolerans]|tara:strand:- start:16349 stop:16717 length:369 start_codon:yes stop_codon:yes gene_type:complete
MKFRFISPTVHGIIDYSAAVALISSPFLLGLGESSPMAKWLSVVTGVAVIIVSLNTTYKFSILHTIPYNGHLLIDLMAATTFAAAPFLFHFTGIDMYYYIANAVVVFLVVALSDNCEPSLTD